MTSLKRRAFTQGVFLAFALCLGCGARTALEEYEDAGAEDSTRNDASTPDAPAEECDGMDNDGDGRIDEALAMVECGTGACRRSACDARFCVPGEPSAERCGGGDEDCDGLVDEELVLGALGPAVEVREGAGGYSRCGTCSYAMSPLLVPQPDGDVFVHWHHGIYGGEEIPNMWGRMLDSGGQGSSEPRLLGERVQLSARRIPGLEASDGLAYAIERIGSRDVPRLWRTSLAGVGEIDSNFDECSRALSIAYVGGRLVSGCTSRGEATFRSEVVGGESREITLDVDEMFYGAELHRSGEGELLLAAYHVDIEREERWMTFGRLSSTLEVLQPLTRSDATYGSGRVAFRVSGGWLWWSLNWPDEIRWERLDEGGQASGPRGVYPFRAANPPLASLALGEGHHLIMIPRTEESPMHMVRIDGEGSVIQILDIELPPNPAGDPDYAAHIDLIEHRGEFWAAWIGSYAADGEANHVQVQRFGCVEP